MAQHTKRYTVVGEYLANLRSLFRRPARRGRHRAPQFGSRTDAVLAYASGGVVR